MHKWRHSKKKYTALENADNPLNVNLVYDKVLDAVTKLDVTAY